MKRIVLCLCALAMVLSLAACGAESAPSSSSSSQEQSASSSQPASESQSESATAADYEKYTFTFEVPEGFTEVDGADAGVTERYMAEDGSVIQLVLVENDGSLCTDLTADMLVPSLEQAFTQQMGSDVTLENVDFSTGDIDGCPSYQLSYTVTLNGVTLHQRIVGINGDMAYTFSFTDVTGGSWGDAFQACVDSITAVEVAS